MKERQRWQPEEDALLRAYVKQYGPRDWNLISQRMGKPLHRDPKSCLERWKNYLKPGLKKGSLTPEEQSLVISLQAKYGNKWKKIAAEVPGRTAKRLGKWWEVFKEKQLKQLQLQNKPPPPPDVNIPALVVAAAAAGTSSPAEKAVQGPYDHILETFAEKYVHAFQPNLNSAVLPVSPFPMPDPDPVLSLGSVNSAAAPPPVLPPWMNVNVNLNATTSSTLSSCTTSSSATPSPSVSLSLSPSEPAALEPELSRFVPVQQMASLFHCVKEVEEGRQSWVQHKKEATWRLSRLEQQLESEKSRKRREKMEEIEAKIRCLREEEMAFLSRIEGEYRERLCALQREADAKEAKLVEAWCGNHAKLAKLVDQIGSHQYCATNPTINGFTTFANPN
ncbi:hypothetical protein TIFTF001_026172 [Ficus carica]|uniref:Uncharacterized protein n=1 Tax=Ficus carica TaxID=3494 RepID=A0AA88DKR5_FICCA|nr:hypothetical protein TIFTF001_026172 [Ficus carica]